MIVPRLNAALPITKDDLMMQHFRQWTQEASLSIPIVGSGDPEGRVEALQYSLYIDRDGTTGTIEYRKMYPEVSGDTKKGWVLL